MTPEEIAERATQIMWEADTTSTWAGMELEAAGPLTATVSLTIKGEHCNGHGTAHGGVIYMLAGTAFAMAINSTNERAVAQQCAITYLAPAFEGQKLTATAKMTGIAGRSGVFDVSIQNQDGKVVAEFRGNSRTIGGKLFEV